MRKQLVYKLEGLDCANCGMKIEASVAKLDGVEEASLNFTVQTLTINLHDMELKNSVEKTMKSIVNKLEPHVMVREIVKTQNEKDDHKHSDSSECCHGEHTHKNNGMKKEFITFSVSAVLFLIPLIFHLPFYIELVFYLSSYFISGKDVLLSSIRNIRNGSIFDENFLMSIATIGAFAIGNYSEGVAVMLFYQIGELFQGYAVNKSRNSITSLMDIRPDYANLLIGDNLSVVTPSSVKIGDIILIKAGEKVALDGTIVSGTSSMDTSALTGESLPREVEIGDEILSGFVNISGVLTVKVEKEFADSTISKILELVEHASSRKAKTEKFITKFARVYTPIVTILALLLAVLPPLIIEGATFSEWIYRALVFLVISCPCALVVSIPLGFFGGIGGASKLGVLVKGANYLEALNNIDVVVFDKTGTLTKGIFQVQDIKAYHGYSADTVLEYAAYGERYSNHPISEAIRNYYKKDILLDRISRYVEIAGKGIQVMIDDKEIYLGNSRMLQEQEIEHPSIDEVGTVVHVVLEKTYIGYILISDEVKEDAYDTISQLKAMGKKVVMLTGDNQLVGKKIANQLEIDTVYAELLPQDKVTHVDNLMKENEKSRQVMFVGDGVNDAPVLALSHVGVAMGGLGSDAAIEAADVILMTDEPRKLLSAFHIAKRTRNIVWQNISLAFAIKAIFLVLGGFGIASMWEAVFADVGVALIAVLNAMRVMKVKD